MSQEVERELGWDDEIVNDGPAFVLLPAGDYNFTVAKFERGRFQGSEKMPPCNEAKLELTIHSPEHGDVTVFHRLLLHTKTEGFLSNFFTGIGQKKPGEKLRMNWNMVTGAKGRCKVVQNKYMSKGEERVNNQVDTFYPYEEYLKHSGGGIPNQNYQQQQQQQQNYQAPFPTSNQQQQLNTQNPNQFTPGQF